MEIKTKLSKKIATAAAILSIGAGVLTSCGTNTNTGTKTIEMWAGGQWTGSDLANLKTFIASYNSNHDINVKLTPKTEFETQYATSIQVGKQPDILVWDRFNTPTFAKQGVLYPIDDLIAQDKIDTSIFQKQAYDELNFDGHQYGLPLDLDIWGIYVNTDMVNEYNTKNPTDTAAIPSTWEELEDTAKKLTVRQNGEIKVAGYSSCDMYEHYIKFFISTGGTFMDSNNQYPDFTSTEAKDTLQYLRAIYQDNVCTSDLNSKDNFKNKKLAMLNQPVYYSSYLKQYAPNLNYEFIPTPKYTKSANGKQGGMIGGYGLALPKPLEKYQNDNWKKKQGYAWDFMKSWLTNEDLQLEWSKTSNTLPALKSIYSSDWIQSTPVLKAAASYADNYECRPQLPGFIYMQINSWDVNMKSYIEATDDSWPLDKIVERLTADAKSIIDIYNK